MADNTKDPKKPQKEQLTLSQAILSPLDSIFQAQIHAARSFLNMLLQIGYPHVVVDTAGHPVKDKKVNPPENFRPYEVDFNFTQNDAEGNPQHYKASIPALALVPLNSLAVSEAEFNFGLKVTSIHSFQQMQDSEKKSILEQLKKELEDKRRNEGIRGVHITDNDVSSDEVSNAMSNRKWNLVKDPKSLKGIISSKPSDKMKEGSEEAIIDISIKLTKTPIPAALDNLLTSLTKAVVVKENEDIEN